MGPWLGFVTKFDTYDWRDLLWSFAILVAAAAAGRIASAIAVRALERWSRKKSSVADVIAVRIHDPVRWLGPLVAVDLALPVVTAPLGIVEGIRQGVVLGAILGLGWLAVQGVCVAETLVLRRFDVSIVDNLHARAVSTRVRGLRNVATFVVIVVTIGFALMSFDRVRQLGTGILASAGLASVMLGFAAQKSLTAILAGVQIAFTQPFRVDDVVIVEGEWGRIEEITLTYVILKIWDYRRLVVPIQYFLDKPFQNWTRAQANLLGTVELHLDYSADVDAIRAEFKRVIDASKLWDHETWGVQVTDSTERTMLVRLLMSARDAGVAFDLRCEVREKIITFLQRGYPGSLPRIRGELTSDAAPATNGVPAGGTRAGPSSLAHERVLASTTTDHGPSTPG